MYKIKDFAKRNLYHLLLITAAVRGFYSYNSPNLTHSVLYVYAFTLIIITNIIGILINENVIRNRIVHLIANGIHNLSIVFLFGLLLYYHDIPEDERYLAYILFAVLVLPDMIKGISFFRNKENLKQQPLQ
jgi:ABC-type proline/glycine betaine transport system permease subunit